MSSHPAAVFMPLAMTILGIALLIMAAMRGLGIGVSLQRGSLRWRKTVVTRQDEPTRFWSVVALAVAIPAVYCATGAYLIAAAPWLVRP